MNTTDATIQTNRIDTPMRFNIQITQHPIRRRLSKP